MITGSRYSADNNNRNPPGSRAVRRDHKEWLGMEYQNQFDLALFDQLPVGILTIESDFCVKRGNRFALALLQVELGANLRDIVHPDSVTVFDSLLSDPSAKSADIQFSSGLNSLYTRIHLADTGRQSTVIVEDISELVALGRQLKSDKQPERKFVQDISNALTSTIGYTELINMILEEREEFSGERLASIRRYEGLALEGLKRADALIRNKKLGPAQQFSPAIPLHRKHVMVVDDEAQITELLCELLRAKQYKVTPFTESIDALDYYRDHWKEIDLVIMDQIMPEMSGITLATELLAFDRLQHIVLCTGDQKSTQEQVAGKVKIKHFLSKPIDINELTQLVSSIID
jgi:CheY-like chemotaxis protein